MRIFTKSKKRKSQLVLTSRASHALLGSFKVPHNSYNYLNTVGVLLKGIHLLGRVRVMAQAATINLIKHLTMERK
jgi:hypothetical protein